MVRVPTPSPHMPSDADWRALIFSLKGVEGRNAWLIREIVEVRNVLLCYNIVILWFFWMFSQALLFLSSFWCFFLTFYRFFILGYFSVRYMNSSEQVLLFFIFSCIYSLIHTSHQLPHSSLLYFINSLTHSSLFSLLPSLFSLPFSPSSTLFSLTHSHPLLFFSFLLYRLLWRCAIEERTNW